MSKIATTWHLMKDAWGVLMRDKALIVFPVVSGIACMLVLVTFIVPFVGAGFFKLGAGESVFYAVLFCYYVANFFVVYFFNAALVDFVVTRVRDGEPTIGGSIGAAAACLPQIATWAVISSTVGVVLKVLSSRAGFIVMSTLRAIFEAVLYLFARTGKVPDGFFEDDLRGAIQPAR